MGLIRKTLAISTVGLVSPSSRKQRVASAQLRELRAQTRLMRQAATVTDAVTRETPTSVPVKQQRRHRVERPVSRGRHRAALVIMSLLTFIFAADVIGAAVAGNVAAMVVGLALAGASALVLRRLSRSSGAVATD